MCMHCHQSHPEGYDAQTTLLQLAGKYRAEWYIQQACEHCALIQQITTWIKRRLTQHSWPDLDRQ